MAPKASREARGYGYSHREARRKWKKRVAAGNVQCARCGKLIDPDEAWDLGHDDDDRTQYAGPEHRRCNRATAGRRPSHRLVAWKPYPKDDPERGIFWGPPGVDGKPIRWSRVWHEWR